MKSIITLGLIMLLHFTTNAQAPVLVKDINPTPNDTYSNSFPGKGIVFNGKLYFAANDYNGRELWKSDGSGGGTELVRDLESFFIEADSDPQFFNIIGNDLYFFANSLAVKLFKLDGNTHHITEVGRLEGGFPSEVVVVGDDIFFAGVREASEGEELLRYYTGSNYLETVEDIFYGPDSSKPRNLTVKGDSLFFSANDGFDGRELWMYDYENDYLIFVADINPSGSSDPHDFIIFNDKLFFTADDGNNGMELWESDGDEFGTLMVANINAIFGSGSDPLNKVIFANKIYFSADNGSSGRELWRYDDNLSSAQLVMDINPFGDSNPAKFGFLQVGINLFFAADDGFNGIELWKTNGTTTSRVTDIDPFGDSNPQDMVNYNGTLVFVADEFHNRELWKTDGTTTSKIKDIQPIDYDAPQIVGVFNNKVFFYANDNVTGSELYSTDGTDAGTILVKDINKGNFKISSSPGSMELYKGSIFFGARDETSFSTGLFKTDGTSAGTLVVKGGGTSDNFSFNSNYIKKAGANLFFSARTNTEGYELWISDSTDAGTLMVKDIYSGSGSSSPRNMIELGTSLIFSATTASEGEELWISDGTSGGTTLLKDIRSGSASSNIDALIVINGKLIFTANNGTDGDEIWVSDGTPVGTVMLKDINPGSSSSSPDNFSVIGSYLYFSANDGTNGKEMWRTDGTPANTILFKDINTGSGSSNPAYYAELGGFIYFSASSGSISSLWRSDGTIGNASQFDPVRFPYGLTKVGSYITFFCIPVGAQGFELWSTDGTNTSQIENFPNNGSSGLSYISGGNTFTFLNKMFFYVDDKEHGAELWQSDGTAAGTFMYDIAPGPQSSYPRNFAGLNTLIFSASNGSNIGTELYKLDVCGSTPDVCLWIGKIDSDWTNVNNWCGGLPDATKDVFISSGTPNQPMLPVGTYSVKGINIPTNDTVSLGSATLEIYGTVSGEGAFKGGPNAELVINGTGAAGTMYFSQLTDGTSNALKNFTQNRSAGSIVLGNKLILTGVYTPTAGTLNSNGNLVLRSNAAGTARIAEGSSAGDYISGEVTVERFIPAGKRAYRQLSGGVNSTGAIRTNWQNGGNYTPGLGMHITGSQSAANGFDQTLSGAANVFTYSPGSPSFTPIPNTDATNLKALQAYRVFVFGDRNANLTIANNTGTGTSNIVLNNDVTLKALGSLATGTVTFNSITGATANGNTDGAIKLGANANDFALIANPYWSPVDWDALSKTDIINTYWIWDPTIGNRGAYTSYTTSSGSSGGGSIDMNLQPGQAIFIRNKASLTTGASITFEEVDKSTGFTNTFRTPNQTPSKIRIYLYENTSLSNNGSMQDGATVAFRDDFSSTIDNLDAAKFTNTDENIAIVRGSSVLGLEARPTVTAADTIPLRIWRLYSNNNYTLRLNGADFDAGISAILVDKKLGQQHILNMNGNYDVPFTFTASDSSSYYDRFMLVLRPLIILPVNFTNVKAAQKNTGIQVEWDVAAEVDVVKYEVERSTNGTAFDKAGTVQASNSKAYNWFDALPNTGTNYYRIKVINKNNTTSYSHIVNVKLGSTKGDIVSVYPNPIKGNVLNVQFINLERGTYTIKLFNQTGQQMFTSTVSTDGGILNQAMQLNKLSAGVYNLVVTGTEGIISTQKIIKEN